MTDVEHTACPRCGAAPGALTLTRSMVAKPLGTYSLSGNQMKVSARDGSPVLDCSFCDLHVVGEFEPDGKHVVFPQPVNVHTEARPDAQ